MARQSICAPYRGIASGVRWTTAALPVRNVAITQFDFRHRMPFRKEHATCGGSHGCTGGAQECTEARIPHPCAIRPGRRQVLSPGDPGRPPPERAPLYWRGILARGPLALQNDEGRARLSARVPGWRGHASWRTARIGGELGPGDHPATGAGDAGSRDGHAAATVRCNCVPPRGPSVSERGRAGGRERRACASKQGASKDGDTWERRAGL